MRIVGILDRQICGCWLNNRAKNLDAPMPWAKQFDEGDVLDKAMQAFWAHGCEAKSIQDLVDCMGLNRGGIYAAFGSKRKLFIRALEPYQTHHRRAWLASLRRRHKPRAAILSVFEGAIGAALSDHSRSGCFLVNTAIELSPHYEAIARLVAEGLSDTEALFRDLILEGKTIGNIPFQIHTSEFAPLPSLGRH